MKDQVGKLSIIDHRISVQHTQLAGTNPDTGKIKTAAIVADLQPEFAALLAERQTDDAAARLARLLTLWRSLYAVHDRIA